MNIRCIEFDPLYNSIYQLKGERNYKKNTSPPPPKKKIGRLLVLLLFVLGEGQKYSKMVKNEG